MNENTNNKPARFSKVEAGWYATENGEWAVIIEVGGGSYVNKYSQDVDGEANDGWALVADKGGALRTDHHAGETLDWYPTKRAAVAEGQKRIAQLEAKRVELAAQATPIGIGERVLVEDAETTDYLDANEERLDRTIEQREAVKTSPVFASFKPETREQIAKSVPTLDEKLQREREREAIVKSLKRTVDSVARQIELRDEKLVLASRAGSSLRQLAEATGLGVETVRRILIARGVATA